MERLRVGVVGVGSVVREIYQYLFFRSEYANLLDIVAVADPNETYRNWFCDTYGIPPQRRFANHADMLAAVDLDAAQINTPDHVHAGPAIDCLEAGLDVLVPKPTAATVSDVHAMIEAVKRSGRLMGVDYHKREDPRIKEAQARYQSGRYGSFQLSVWYMVDKLFVADPNHDPMFFATADYAETNTPVSFLTVHMCDALLRILDLRPVEVRATGWSQKLPSLEPVAVRGYDLVDTEVRFENGGVAHIITGWHLPNTAHATTVQSSRIVCTDGLIDLDLDKGGYYEIHDDGIAQVNSLFRTFERDGSVTGYGMVCPGRIYQRFLQAGKGALTDEERQRMLTPMELGFYTTLVAEAAEKSLELGADSGSGAVAGPALVLRDLLVKELGAEVAATYGY